MVVHVSGALVLFTTDGRSCWWSSSVVHYTVKNGALRYTLIGVVEEVLLQHPCLASIFSSKIPVECIPTLWTNT